MVDVDLAAFLRHGPELDDLELDRAVDRAPVVELVDTTP